MNKDPKMEQFRWIPRIRVNKQQWNMLGVLTNSKAAIVAELVSKEERSWR